ncbi:MAG: HIT family protein [Planctomycetes bacterium]|nr:HIT family protein [Planctomycetota bacterium]
MNELCCDIVPKFGGPGGQYFENRHWTAQVRPRQVTLGSSVLISRRHVESFAALSPEEVLSFGAAVREIEGRLKEAFVFDKINYLMLMMVDRHLHFHVIPRYAQPRTLAGIEWKDASWPKAPDLGTAVDADAPVREAIVTALRAVQETAR